ncbi:hypothetical protein [Dysgonomonas sp. BGC7]|nr:hypothetical protein [Dysgonomonas sp. BGC7]
MDEKQIKDILNMLDKVVSSADFKSTVALAISGLCLVAVIKMLLS